MPRDRGACASRRRRLAGVARASPGAERGGARLAGGTMRIFALPAPAVVLGHALPPPGGWSKIQPRGSEVKRGSGRGRLRVDDADSAASTIAVAPRKCETRSQRTLRRHAERRKGSRLCVNGRPPAIRRSERKLPRWHPGHVRDVGIEPCRSHAVPCARSSSPGAIRIACRQPHAFHGTSLSRCCECVRRRWRSSDYALISTLFFATA